MELQFVQETWSKKQIREEKDEMVTLQEQEQDFEKFEADFEKALLPTASSAASGSTGPSSSGHIGPAEASKPMNEESMQQIEKTKVAIQALRKRHSAWDSGERDWQAVLKHSQDCDITKGTEIEADLKELISTCSRPCRSAACSAPVIVLAKMDLK